MLETAGLNRLGQLNRVASSFDIGFCLLFSRSGDIVNGCKVEEVFDVALEVSNGSFINAQQWLAQIPLDGYKAVTTLAEAFLQGFKFVF